MADSSDAIWINEVTTMVVGKPPVDKCGHGRRTPQTRLAPGPARPPPLCDTQSVSLAGLPAPSMPLWNLLAPCYSTFECGPIDRDAGRRYQELRR